MNLHPIFQLEIDMLYVQSIVFTIAGIVFLIIALLLIIQTNRMPKWWTRDTFDYVIEGCFLAISILFILGASLIYYDEIPKTKAKHQEVTRQYYDLIKSKSK